MKKNKSDSGSKAIRRILVLRYSSLGDVVLTNPVLDQLGAVYPDAEIYFATKDRFVPLVAAHPAVLGVVVLNGGGFIPFVKHLLKIIALKPSMILDLHDSLRTRLIRLFFKSEDIAVYEKEGVQRRLIVKKTQTEPSLPTVLKYLKTLEKWGISSSSSIPCRIQVSRVAKEFSESYLKRHQVTKTEWVVGIGPGATWKTKQWLPEYYAELASHWVQKRKALILWFGDSKEVDLIHSIQSAMTVRPSERGLCVAGELTLEQTSALIGRCNVFIGNDSGLIHLASARGVPVTVIYGSTTRSLGFEPWGKHQVAEVTGLDCRPCDVHGKKTCPLGHFKCMKNLTVAQVEAQVDRLRKK